MEVETVKKTLQEYILYKILCVLDVGEKGTYRDNVVVEYSHNIWAIRHEVIHEMVDIY